MWHNNRGEHLIISRSELIAPERRYEQAIIQSPSVNDWWDSHGILDSGSG